MKLVTVIVPAYNASAFIAETLDSILSQTYSNIELIVVDDGSTDDTAAIVRSYGEKCRYIWRPNSGGCAAPRNTGLEYAQGEFVAFCDADDLLVEDKIARQVEHLVAHPDVCMTIPDYLNFSERKEAPAHFSTCPRLQGRFGVDTGTPVLLESGECRALLIRENFSIASSPLFRTTLIRELAGFEESLLACEDFHLIYRVAANGPVLVDRKVGFKRRLHDLNMSGDNERMLRNFVRSRSLLESSEKDSALASTLRERVRMANRSLQDCLVRKRAAIAALTLYRETFPPRSIKQFRFDVKLLAKILLIEVTSKRSETEPAESLI